MNWDGPDIQKDFLAVPRMLMDPRMCVMRSNQSARRFNVIHRGAAWVTLTIDYSVLADLAIEPMSKDSCRQVGKTACSLPKPMKTSVESSPRERSIHRIP